MVPANNGLFFPCVNIGNKGSKSSTLVKVRQHPQELFCSRSVANASICVCVNIWGSVPRRLLGKSCFGNNQDLALVKSQLCVNGRRVQ